MKTLYLLRHCEAVKGSPDSGRNLSPKGRADALELGRKMAKQNYAPALALCSPAQRTRQTLEQVWKNCAIGAAQYPNNFYNADTGILFPEIQSLPQALGSVLIVAHNPGIYILARELAGSGEPKALSRLHSGYDPGTLSVFECPIDTWAHLSLEKNTLRECSNPLDYNP